MRNACSIFIISIAAISSLDAARAETSLSGTGSAFAAPIYTRWAQEAKPSVGVQVNYQATGSGVGQKQAAAGTVDFGASDVAMDAKRIEEADLLQFPTVVGGLDVIVNIPGVGANALKLDGPVIADIYLGAITRWNDPRIVALNHGLALPDLLIIPIHHSNASGTTFALSRYLSKVSETWKTRMGVALTLEWPSGVGVHGSAGTAGEVPRTLGSIGYAENSYVTTNHLAPAKLLNRAGKYVAPSEESFAAAAANADWAAADNFAVDLTNMPGEKSWPLVTATFVLAPKAPAKAERTAALLKFFDWAFAHGDKAAKALQYVPLPHAVKDQIRAAWRQKAAFRSARD
ncbi:phosphate ABC transporter substrate-binding protein PstS [Methylosinus sporium]|uniref:Phosphate-binding protein PstS n=1 Tax=Methylosinus sporium TaxID=428 RepID=A0A549SUU3_METSR|nr:MULTISPECIES: phosphate ABC transporter substrate-binding protein PstS [Methylosinus]MBU3890214.1 phosphate ABC transporter substrate-binding protein PstS [Methylosinus sp. KRF6]TRL33415.1 phosphate ABC transporter substrate-binding protein PstS [Methylosinus sporium]